MDLGKSSGRIFGVSVHLGACFSCYFHILFTPWTLQNSHAEAFCLWKDDCLWKNKKRKKVLDKKKRKKEKKNRPKERSTTLSRKEKFLCGSDQYWQSSTLVSRFQTKKLLLNQNLPYKIFSRLVRYVSSSLDTKKSTITSNLNFECFLSIRCFAPQHILWFFHFGRRFCLCLW